MQTLQKEKSRCTCEGMKMRLPQLLQGYKTNAFLNDNFKPKSNEKNRKINIRNTGKLGKIMIIKQIIFYSKN